VGEEKGEWCSGRTMMLCGSHNAVKEQCYCATLKKQSYTGNNDKVTEL